MDISDLFNDGSLELAQFQNVKSEEELRKWATEESLPEGRKALLLITKGFALQKVAVLNGLHRLTKEREFQDVLIFVLRELPTWEESLQVEAGNGFLTALRKNLIPHQHQEALLKVALTLLSTWSAPVHAVWLQVFSSLLKVVTLALVKRHCVPVALHLGESSQAVSTRIVAVQLLGLLAERLQQDFRGDILQKALLLAQDTSYDIRKNMCPQLKKITRSVAEDLQPRVFSEVLKLVNDEENEVKREAVSLLADVIDLLPCDLIQDQVVPVLRSDLLTAQDTALRLGVAETFGMLIVKLEAELQDEDFRTQCLDFFKSLASSPLEKERKAAAFNFPAVLSTLGGSAFATDLKLLYEKLSQDASVEVRSTVAASLHEVLRLAPREGKSLCSVFQSLLSDPKLSGMLAKNLGVMLSLLAPEAAPGQILGQLVTLVTSSASWRLIDTLLGQLNVVLDLFSLSEITERLQPAAVSLFTRSCLPVKVRLAKLLAEILHRTYMADQREELCATVIKLMGESSSAQDRIVFVDFTLRMLALNSRRFYQRHFFPVLLKLSGDPVRSVRVKFAQHLVSLTCVFTTEADMQTALHAATARLQSDSDCEVARLANEVQTHVMKSDYWTTVQAADRDEVAKQRREDLQDEREQREKDEAKKKLVQDLTEKARLDYLRQYKEKKGSASIPRKNLLKSSLTSTRIPQAKPKVDLSEVGRKHTAEAKRNGGNSPAVASSPGAKSATAKPATSSLRKK